MCSRCNEHMTNTLWWNVCFSYLLNLLQLFHPFQVVEALGSCSPITVLVLLFSFIHILVASFNLLATSKKYYNNYWCHGAVKSWFSKLFLIWVFCSVIREQSAWIWVEEFGKLPPSSRVGLRKGFEQTIVVLVPFFIANGIVDTQPNSQILLFTTI